MMPVTKGDSGWVAVYQLFTSMSTWGAGSGTKPYMSLHPPSWNTCTTSSGPSSTRR